MRRPVGTRDPMPVRLERAPKNRRDPGKTTTTEKTRIAPHINHLRSNLLGYASIFGGPCVTVSNAAEPHPKAARRTPSERRVHSQTTAGGLVFVFSPPKRFKGNFKFGPPSGLIKC